MMRGRLGSRFTKATQWRVGQRLPQSQLAGRSLRCLVLAKFPEPDGTGGESILGLPGKPDFSEWQIVLSESQCGFVATGTNVRDLPLPRGRGTRETAQPRLSPDGSTDAMAFS